MPIKNYCFSIYSYQQAVKIINVCKEKKITPILFIKFELSNGLGIDWITELNNILKRKFKLKKFKIFVDVKNNYGLFIRLVEKKIDYIKVTAKNNTLIRLKEIAKLNKVSINPNFSVVDLARTNEIEKKLTELYAKDN